MKKTILSLSVVAISLAFSNDINMGESIFNDKSLKDGDYINDSVALTPKQKALIDIAKRKQKEAEEQIAILEEENAQLQQNRNYQENYQREAYNKEQAYAECRTHASEHNAENMRIISHNCNFFSCAAKSKDGLIVYTPSQNYIVK